MFGFWLFLMTLNLIANIIFGTSKQFFVMFLIKFYFLHKKRTLTPNVKTAFFWFGFRKRWADCLKDMHLCCKSIACPWFGSSMLFLWPSLNSKDNNLNYMIINHPCNVFSFENLNKSKNVNRLVNTFHITTYILPEMLKHKHLLILGTIDIRAHKLFVIASFDFFKSID